MATDPQNGFTPRRGSTLALLVLPLIGAGLGGTVWAVFTMGWVLCASTGSNCGDGPNFGVFVGIPLAFGAIPQAVRWLWPARRVDRTSDDAQKRP
jgi:hypothetical protein